MKDIILRPVDPLHDAQAIAAIYAPYVTDAWASFEESPPTAAEMQERAEALTAKGYPYFVAELAGRVLAYAYAGPYRVRHAYRFSVENSIYMHHDAHGQGVGKQLMDIIITHCRDAGFKTMVSVVGLNPDLEPEQNQSVRFHQKLGFTLIGVLENIGKKHGRWTGTAMLQLRLDAD